jgi:eukaryotic-like serine/threonine-protein kinase
MSDTTSKDNKKLSPTVLGQIELICDRFESAWRGEAKPRIEDYWREADGPDLLRELLVLELAYRIKRHDHPQPAEYHGRFAAHAKVIRAAFETVPAHHRSPAPHAPASPRSSADRNLLFGVLAMQMDFVTREALIAAVSTWVLDKSKPLDQILVEQGALATDERDLLEPLIQKHLERHGGDAGRSLASVGSRRSAREALGHVADPELDASLALLGDSDETAIVGDQPEAKRFFAEHAGAQRFHVLRPLARGGLGEVFVARDQELRREVALKLIQERHASDAGSRTRFQFEAEITGRLEHPGVIPVYGMGVDARGRPYYAMRFVRGESLKESIARFHGQDGPTQEGGERSLAFRELLGRFVDVCNTMAYAHGRGILHRDLKPANIMLGPYGETLVVDWGLAKVAGRPDGEPSTAEASLELLRASAGASTEPGSWLGTPAYMSPEQAAGQIDQLGPASDVYSLGAMLYNLLTGKTAFDGTDVFALLGQIRAGDFPPPRSVDSTIDPALESVCLKAMALTPGDRYTSCRTLADDLKRWAADEPVSAWQEPFGRRFRRWAKRNRTAVAAAVVALMAGVVGLGAVAGVQARANDRLRRANDETNTALAATKKAQTQTQEALVQSEESRQQAEAVSTFMVQAFRSPDPSQDGRQVKVADVLERANERLDKEFAGSLASRGAMLDALGRTYLGLGLYDRSVTILTQARGVRQAALGPDHRDTLESCNNLANAYRSAGKLPDAVALHEATLRQREAALGPDHPDTLKSSNNLADAYRSAGKLPEALALHEATLKLREAALGPDHPDTLASRDNLAVDYASAGRTVEALALHASTLKQREAALGPDHPETLASRIHLATAYRRAGRTSEAIALNEGTLKLYEAKLGPDHPNTLASRNNLAAAYGGAGRFSEAIALDEGTLKLYEAKLGPDHPDTLISRNNLAVAYSVGGRTSEALPLFELTLKLREAKLGLDHPDTLASRNNLALAYRRAGRTSESIALNEATLKLREAKLGLDHPDTLRSRSNLANAYDSAGRYSEALALHETTLKLREAKLGPDHPSTLTSRDSLAIAYLAIGRTSRAIALHESTLELAKAKLGPDHPETLTSRSNLANAYNSAGRYFEALALHETTLKLREAKLGPDHPGTLASRTGIASAFESLGRWAEAEGLFRDTVARRRRTDKPDSPVLADDLDGLGGTLLKQERGSEAAPVLRECLAIREKAIPDDWRRYNTMSRLGGALLTQVQHAEAEPLVVQGYEGMKAREPRIPAPSRFLLREGAERVVRLYEAWGKPDQARAWKAKVGMPDLPADVFAARRAGP